MGDERTYILKEGNYKIILEIEPIRGRFNDDIEKKGFLYFGRVDGEIKTTGSRTIEETQSKLLAIISDSIDKEISRLKEISLSTDRKIEGAKELKEKLSNLENLEEYDLRRVVFKEK